MSLVLRRALLLAALVAGAACTEKGRSLVLVDVKPTDVVGVARVRVVVTQGGQSVGHAETDWSGSGTLELGVHVDKRARGSVAVVACALGSSGAALAAGSTAMPQMVTVAPGEQSAVLVTVVLAPPGPPSPLCADGGMAGRGGAGGSTGGMSGSGGGGAGGPSGSGGAGGVSGSGGAVGGTGGIGGSVGGAGGLGGRGGNAGSGGTAGSIGGRGGAAGTGTAGAAGRGGTGGSATAGTGGAPPEWSGARLVSGDAVPETRPSVAVDFNGNAVVVMEHGGEIWFSHYTAATDRWSSQSVLAKPATGNTYAEPVVAVDGSGRYLAVWGPGTSTTGIWQSTSADGVIWTPAEPLPMNANLAYRPVLAVNSDGAAVVAWNERLSTGNLQVVVRVRSKTLQWADAVLMRAGDDANDRLAAVAVSRVGEVFVVWEQPSAGMNSIWSRQLGTNNLWTDAGPFETYDANSSYAPAIATNASSDAIVTYLQRVPGTTGNTQLWAQRYTGGVWGPTLNVTGAVNIDSSQPPSVTLDDSGTATVAFGLQVSGKYNVYTSRQMQAETMWPLSPTAMESDNTAAEDGADGLGAAARATLPTVRNDAFGGAVVIWRKRVGPAPTRFDLFASRFAGGGWGFPTKIETLDTGATPSDPASVFAPVLGINGNGLAVAAWYYGGPSGNVSQDVYANVLRGP